MLLVQFTQAVTVLITHKFKQNISNESLVKLFENCAISNPNGIFTTINYTLGRTLRKEWGRGDTGGIDALCL